MAGAGIALLVHRTPPIRVAFNLALFAGTALLAAAVFHAIGSAGLGPRTWAAAAVAALVSSSASSLLIACAMRLSGERLSMARVLGMLRFSALVSGTNASLGLAAAAVLHADPLSGVLLLSPAAVIFVAYRAYHSERQQLVSLEFLYDASRALSRAGDVETGLAGMLALAADTFRAELAEILLLPGGDDDAPGTRVTVHADEGVEVRRDLDPAVAEHALALLGDDPRGRLVEAATVGGALGEHLAAIGVRDAMLAALPGDRRLVGVAIMGNRVGVGGGFGGDDVRLFETLGRHTGAALGQERLERRVSAMRETQEELYQQAFHDGLTGLANRLLFMDRVEHALSRRGGNVVVLYVDLDDFKPVNDQFGHEAGDELLCATAERLRESLRAADTPARLGGDEFAVLLVDIDPVHITTVAERILANFARPVDLSCGEQVGIHASLGVALAESGTMDADELVRNADAAMYASKHGGKRGYRIHGRAEPAAV
jgi:diguanylate cyclase (GGDEF)-like protein